MPVKVYFDNNGKIYYMEPLHEAMFFVPEGVELDMIDMSNPEEPVAITKPIMEAEPQQEEQEEIADAPAEAAEETQGTEEA